MNICKYIIPLLMGLFSLPSYAQGEKCDIDISVANITKGEVVPQAVSSRLESYLTRALSRAGLTSAPYDSRFFVAGRFDDGYKDVLPGYATKVVVNTTLTLYVGDAEEHKIFSSESFDMKGVGLSEQEAYSNALKKLNGSNAKLVSFLENAKQKIVDYYDNNYMSYINNAKKAAEARNFEEALYYATAIPTCCKGYNEAQDLSIQIYNQHRNYDGQNLLAQARAAWAADPTAAGAEKAHKFLSQIDPSSSVAAEAKALSNDMSKVTMKQWEFENVTKYKDQLAMEKKRMANEAALESQRIAANASVARAQARAARDVAVAYAKSRPRVIYTRGLPWIY